jgi:N-acyl-L-homoserine lactone synthetase
MIHMVTDENRAIYARQLAEMHRLRKVHFVDERGWSALTVRGDQEVDQYDDARAIYFMALDKLGRIQVCMRARPTEDRSMLADIFPHLVAPAAKPVSAPGVWEISRIFATRGARGRRGVLRRAELFLATVEAACAMEVTRLVGMTDVYLLPQTLAAGWEVRVLGLPARYAEGEAIAVEVDSSEAGLVAMQERLAIRRSAVMHLETAHPLSELGPVEAEALFGVIGVNARAGDLALASALSARVAELQDLRSDREIEDLVDGAMAAWAQAGRAPAPRRLGER